MILLLGKKDICGGCQEVKVLTEDTMAKFSFVGGSKSGSKLSWPLEAQAIIVRTHKVDGIGGTKAFEAGVAEYNAGVDAGTITGPALPTFAALPASYQGKNAGSVLYGMEQRFLNRCNEGDVDTIALATKYGLVVAAE